MFNIKDFFNFNKMDEWEEWWENIDRYDFSKFYKEVYGKIVSPISDDRFLKIKKKHKGDMDFMKEYLNWLEINK
jgi:hypothetical protein